MCGPPAIAAIAAGVATVGTLYSGLSKASAQRYQAKVADQNAKLAGDQARDAIERGQIADRDLQRQNAQLLGAQRAAQAANGVDTSSGSAAQVQADAASIGQEDVSRQRRNFGNEVKGYDMQSWNYSAQADADRAAAHATTIGTYFSAASTALGGVSQFQTLSAAQTPKTTKAG